MRSFLATILGLMFVSIAAFAASPTIPMFSQVDTNGDGSVSNAELASAPGSYEVSFRGADQDGDGKLSEAEYAAATSPGSGAQASDIAKTN